jgi:hypothetical protein
LGVLGHHSCYLPQYDHAQAWLSWVFTQALYPSQEVKDKEEKEEKMKVDDKEKDQEK